MATILTRRAFTFRSSGKVLALVLSAVAAAGTGLLASSALMSFLSFLLCGIVFGLAFPRGRGTNPLPLPMALIENDSLAAFLTDAEGLILSQSRTADERYSQMAGQPLSRVLAEIVAHPAAVLFRMHDRIATLGAAAEVLSLRRGLVRLSGHRVADEGILWRIEDLTDDPAVPSGAGNGLPMLTMTQAGTILSMNEPMRQLVGQRVKTLERIFQDLPLRPGEEHVIHGVKGPIRAIVALVQGPTDRQELYLVPVVDKARPAGDPFGFERLPVALLQLGAKGELVAANEAARSLLGASAQCETLSDLVEGPGRPVRDWVADAMQGRAEHRPEVLRLRSAAEDRYLQVALSRVVIDGRPGLMAVLSDATPLKTIEAQFVQSQKMQAVGQLAGGVAHDFNNLLTAITGHCDLLLLRRDASDPDYGDLMQINQNANRASSLVGQLLAFSRKQTLRPTIIDLRDTLSDLTHLLNRLVGEKVSLTFEHDHELRPVRADKRQFEQVIMNLVVNARDAMPGGGRIFLTTRNLHLDRDLGRDRATVPAGDYAVVQVRDEGCGIAPDHLDKIFEPFFTTKRPGEGTGLGLSMVYGVVKQSGGYIFCDSVPGRGTTFSLYLPMASETEIEQERPAPAPASLGPRAAPTVHGLVLLVEDEAPVRAFAARALRFRGFTVLEAESGEAALSLLEDTALQPDIIVTDMIMPGLDGPAWVKQALQERPGIRVIFISGYSEDHLAAERDQIPNSIFLQKPFSLADLTATVQSHILMPAAQPSTPALAQSLCAVGADGAG